MCTAINHDKLTKPFLLVGGLKVDSKNYCQFLEHTSVKQRYKKQSVALKWAMIFIHGNAPLHVSKYSID